jgi:hypothetical protein
MRLSKKDTHVAAREKNSFSVDDICAIIKASAESGVSRIEVGQLKIEFQGTPQPHLFAATLQEPPAQETIERIEEQAVRELDNETKADEISDMLVTDPLAYEELISQAEQRAHAEKDDD